MSHPSEASLALYAGGELRLWTRMQVARHVRGCDRCGRVVEEFREIREFAASEAKEPPLAVNWDAMAAEMKANIRVGLAAGECVAAETPKYKARWRTPAFVVPVLLLILAGWLLQIYPPIKRGAQRAAAADVLLEADAEGIGMQADEGRGFTLLHTGAENVLFSVRGQSAVRARYVDAQTGQVTISHVYAQ